MGAFRQNREATERGIIREETGIALSFAGNLKLAGWKPSTSMLHYVDSLWLPFSDIQAAVSEKATSLALQHRDG
jgi:hypothetical protein